MHHRTILIAGIVVAIFYTGVRTAPSALAPTSVFASLPHDIKHSIVVGWVGDIAPSDDVHAFDAVKDALTTPDLMIANLEGTFALPDRTSKCELLTSMCYAFRGESIFTEALLSSGIDLVTLTNNHSYDYGREGLEDTEAVLIQAGIPFVSPTSPTTTIVVGGKRVGVLGLSSTEPASTITDYSFIAKQITELKRSHDFVIVVFHGGAEGADKTLVTGQTEYMGNEDRGNVELVARTAIDAGADLILGAGPHVLRKIEEYKGVPIAYSLGNFYGGGGKLVTTGILGVSGIFEAALSTDRPTRYGFTSVVLSPAGIPSIDPTEQGRYLIESLSR